MVEKVAISTRDSRLHAVLDVLSELLSCLTSQDMYR